MVLFFFDKHLYIFQKTSMLPESKYFRRFYFNVCIKQTNANTINKTIHGDDSSLQFKSDLTENISIDLYR